MRRVEPIPADYEVQPLTAGGLPRERAGDRATCGYCGLSWDDGEVTGLTPAPSGRCPFEPFHIYPDDEPEPTRDRGRQRTGLYNAIIAGAEQHGTDSEPEHEIGDLQEAVAVLLGLIPDDRLRDVPAGLAAADLEGWAGGDNGAELIRRAAGDLD